MFLINELHPFHLKIHRKKICSIYRVLTIYLYLFYCVAIARVAMLKLANGVRNLVSLLLKPLAYYEINALPGTLHTHSILASPIEKKA